ncbi:hypothetical protein [Fimbriiglobus ruber]|uniref:hypothetical protein n=1 Tax=Fimbriiglobus ruber TaxID=1908690 RepID=UPI00187A5C47|nr:hypothetical protein [Fimbriiglobus ruber]
MVDPLLQVVDPLLQVLGPLTMTLAGRDEIPDADGQGFLFGFAGGRFRFPGVPRADQFGDQNPGRGVECRCGCHASLVPDKRETVPGSRIARIIRDKPNFRSA